MGFMTALKKFTTREPQQDGEYGSTSSSSRRNSNPKKMSKDDKIICTQLLEEAEMFKKVPPHQLQKIVQEMTPRHLARNEELLRQGEPSDKFFLLESGQIRRTYVDPHDGKSHTVKFAIQAKSINSMRILSGEPVFSTVKCVSEDGCKVYQMLRPNFLQTLEKNPKIATSIAEGLCEQLRRGSKTFQTPLLEQHSQEINVPAVSIAAGIESYYRSALNAMLNARLTGVKAELFPNMHIQVPVRVAYITGFKGLRAYFDETVDPDLSKYPNAVRLATAISPGIIMNPISSILEASNAGHMNKEPMHTRWIRGALPRCGREIIFGVGLNQMSDYFEERITPYCKGHDMIANAAGSLLAGVVSGYLSHVPHNLSTLKLLEPHLPYSQLYQTFVNKSVPPVVDRMLRQHLPPTTTTTATTGATATATATAITSSSFTRTAIRTIFATLFPRGVMIRTTQIVGSFIILNGTINYLQLKEHTKIQRHMKGHDATKKA